MYIYKPSISIPCLYLLLTGLSVMFGLSVATCHSVHFYITMQMALYDKRCPCSIYLPPARRLDVSTASMANMHAV